MNLHIYPSSSDAYDATQTQIDVHNGDVLVGSFDQVIGVAATWPVAVTVSHGQFHTVDWESVAKARGLDCDLPVLAPLIGVPPDSVVYAIQVARERGWAVDPGWAHLVPEVQP